DRVGVMRAGRLLQIGTPAEIYERPLTPFVARFVGDANLWSEQVGGAIRKGMVRPGRVQLGGDAGRCASRFDGRGTRVDDLGAHHVVEVELESGARLRARARANDAALPAIGASIAVGVDPGDTWIVPGDDREEAAP